MNTHLFFVGLLVLINLSRAAVPIQPLLATRPTIYDPAKGCCYDDPCVQNQICAHVGTKLTDACNRTYEVATSSCELSYVRCCAKNQCDNNNDQCAKLTFKSRPTVPVPPNDIFCNGVDALLSEQHGGQCVTSGNPLMPIDIIAKGTQAEYERILMRDNPTIPFVVEREVNESSTSTVRAPVTLGNVLARPGEVEFNGCTPSATGECSISITIIVENTISTSRRRIKQMVSDATTEIEASVEFASLFSSSATTSRRIVFVERAIYCTRVRTAYLCLHYYFDVM